MNTRTITATLAAALISVPALAGIASAQVANPNGFDLSSGASPFAPRVPVSEFAQPASWLDPSRLHISTTVSVGTGFGGGIEDADIAVLVGRAGQEMEDRPVVPDPEPPQRLPRQNVSSQPLHLLRLLTQAILRVPHPRHGNVQHRDVPESPAKQRGGQA